LPARLGDLGRGRLWAVLAAALLVGVPAAAGTWRLAQAKPDAVPGVTLRLVQPSIPQTLKNDQRSELRNFQRLLGLSRPPSADQVTDVIWPEAAAPPLLERYPDVRQAMAAVTPAGGLLLTGAERAEPAEGWPPRAAWNSLDVLDASGAIIATYDKGHLVPFGEYVPLRHILPINKIVPSPLDFSAGPGPQTLRLPGLPPVSPLICYEAIFPGAVIDPQDRPQWLLNVTNDAWYGATSGPFQHFAIARTRAVEEGLPLVRAANNGISGVIDAYGRVKARLDLNAIGALDSPLPAAARPTLYEFGRDSVFFGASLLFLAVIFFITRFNRHLGDVT